MEEQVSALSGIKTQRLMYVCLVIYVKVIYLSSKDQKA